MPEQMRLKRLYRDIFDQLVAQDAIETAYWFRARSIDGCPDYWRAKRHTNIPPSAEITLIGAYRCLIQMGRRELANLLRDEVLENPRYRQFDLFRD